MLKRIRTEQVQLGMFIHELCGSWMAHPFWRTSFLLDDERDLQRMKGCGIREVWIDSSRGLDVADSLSHDEVTAAVDEQLQHAATLPLIGAKNSLETEVEHAVRICARAKGAVESLFHNARLGQAVEADQMLPLVEEICDSITRNAGALISLARLKTQDEYTYLHSVAVCGLMMALAHQLHLNDMEVREAGMAGLLHDLGKARVPLTVLNKPGPLTEHEFATMQSHPLAGHTMLLNNPEVCANALDVVLHHHEKIDGSGYPHHLQGDQISLFAKMAAVCDVYDAITSDRPYKIGWDPAESIRKMTEWSQGHFAQDIFYAFVKTVGIYPTGSLVRLESGRLAVVLEQNSKSLLVPKVKVFYSTRSHMHMAPKMIDLGLAGCADRIIARENPESWHFPELVELWAGDSLPSGKHSSQ